MDKYHECEDSKKVKSELGLSIENREGSWYIYRGDDRGSTPIRFCPYCGDRLVEGEDSGR